MLGTEPKTFQSNSLMEVPELRHGPQRVIKQCSDGEKKQFECKIRRTYGDFLSNPVSRCSDERTKSVVIVASSSL